MNPARPLVGAVITFLFFLLGAGASAQTTVLSEGFEGTFPGSWSVGDANGAGTPAYWGKVTLPAFGTPPTRGGTNACYCAGTGYAGSSANPTYQNSMSGFMSRSINLTGFSSATLSFWYVIPALETGLFSPYDYMRVKIDGTNIEFFRGEAQSSWTQASINLSAYVGGTHTLTFEFISNGTFAYEGAYLDDILLVGDDANDEFSEAFILGAITRTRSLSGGMLNSPTDVDMVSFSVSAGQRISFDIDRPSGSTLDSVLRLFDSSGNQLPAGFNDDGRGPGEAVSFESYLEYSFTNSGTYYVGISSYPNTNYSGATGTGDATGTSTGGYTLVISPGLAGTIQRTGGSDDYPLDLLRTGSTPLALDPAKKTWLVIHGWNSSRTNDNILSATTNLAQARSGDQILTLDWSTAANTGLLNPFDAEISIVPVAQWAANALMNSGFRGTNLNFVGHSFGSYVADEIAQRIPGGVNTIVALDPAADVLSGFDPVSNNEINFARDSLFSWAFHSSNFGSDYTPLTADESFIVNNSGHGEVVFVFAYLLANPSDLVARFFGLENLLNGFAGPWTQDQYVSPFITDANYRNYEAVLTADSTLKRATNITYVATPPEMRVTSVSTLTIGNGEVTPVLGKGTDYGTIQAGSSGPTNYFTLNNSGGTSLQIQSVVVPTGFQVVASPATPVPWAQSTTLGIRFAPSTAGTFSGNVFITNNTPGGSPFRFAITGTATNPLSAPIISAQPASQFGVAGSNVLLSVSVTGTSPLFYQWQKNGQAVTDATNSTLNLTNLVRSAGGIFSVIITNQVGNITSSSAVVRVLVPQRFAHAPVRLGNGQVRLVFGDPTASVLTVNELTNFVVEATTNVLSTNWVRYTNGFSIVGGMVQFDDPDAPGSPRRFYRVIER